MAEWQVQPTTYLGPHWRAPAPPAGQTQRVVQVDANWWKSFVYSRLSMAVGDAGHVGLYGRPGDHEFLTAHLTGEYGTRTEGNGRVVYVWKERPGHAVNHWWDCLVYAACAACTCGLVPVESAPRPAPAAPVEAAPARPARAARPQVSWANNW